ncbi:MAG TPA: hypothetical protein PKX10_00220 [Propioniciclava tarda]|nr:hypothetical protein [Propioniciclava tarda]HQA29831.1 hypothetical protein [Propioniciclava tarda]HQD59752.1 hypothetical protein [Propioniciclava tarda]
MKSIVAHLSLVVVGSAAILWALVLGASPALMCRDAVMRPGDSCANADGTQTQTYEQRASTWQGARPVVGAVGLALVVFGGVLVVQDARTRRTDAAASVG